LFPCWKDIWFETATPRGDIRKRPTAHLYIMSGWSTGRHLSRNKFQQRKRNEMATHDILDWLI
jgi:hypothetical protein